MKKIQRILNWIKGKEKDDPILDSWDFYEVMQSYRHSDMTDQQEVIRTFENVQKWIRENYKK